jgi:hypothetical protein
MTDDQDRTERLRQIERDCAADMRMILDRPTGGPVLPAARVVQRDARGLFERWRSSLIAACAAALVCGCFVGAAMGTYAGCRAMEKQADLRAHLRRYEVLSVVTQCFDAWYERIRPSAEGTAKVDTACDRAIDEVVEATP